MGADNKHICGIIRECLNSSYCREALLALLLSFVFNLLGYIVARIIPIPASIVSNFIDRLLDINIAIGLGIPILSTVFNYFLERRANSITKVLNPHKLVGQIKLLVPILLSYGLGIKNVFLGFSYVQILYFIYINLIYFSQRESDYEFEGRIKNYYTLLKKRLYDTNVKNDDVFDAEALNSILTKNSYDNNEWEEALIKHGEEMGDIFWNYFNKYSNGDFRLLLDKYFYIIVKNQDSLSKLTDICNGISNIGDSSINDFRLYIWASAMKAYDTKDDAFESKLLQSYSPGDDASLSVLLIVYFANDNDGFQDNPSPECFKSMLDEVSNKATYYRLLYKETDGIIYKKKVDIISEYGNEITKIISDWNNQGK